MSEIAFLNSIAYQLIVDALLAVALFCIVVLMSSQRSDARAFGLAFLAPFMTVTVVFNVMLILGRCEVPTKSLQAEHMESQQDGTLATAIRLYEYKAKELKARELELNIILEPVMKPMISKKDIDGLQELADRLPRGYGPKRRVYEAMIRIEEARRK